MNPDSSKPFSYDLEVLTLVNNEGEGFDIRKVFTHCKIWEDISQNFLLGEIGISDSTGMLENAKIFGQETLRIRFKSPFGMEDEIHDDDVIDQIFRIYKVGQVQRIGQNTLIYLLQFSAPEFIQSRRIRISQAFRGSMTDIAGVIANEHLGIEIADGTGGKLVPYFQVREKSKGDNFHVVIPNWPVNYAINWCCAQAQGIEAEAGLQDSYFFWQTANAGYRIQSLASMMEVDYLNGDPFVYAPANTGDPNTIPWDNVEPGRMGMGRRILAYQIGQSANVLEGVVEGLFGSRQVTIDNTYQYHHEKSYNYLDRFYGGGDMAMNPYPIIRQEDEVMHIGEAAGEGEDVSVSTYATYDNVSAYDEAHQILTSDRHFVNDEGNKIHQANHNAHEGSEQFRQAVDQILKYYSIQLLLPIRTDITCGNLINLEIPPAKPGEKEVVDSLFHSGKHLITGIEWEITFDECRTNVRVIKDSLINRIETTVPKLPDRMDEE